MKKLSYTAALAGVAFLASAALWFGPQGDQESDRASAPAEAKRAAPERRASQQQGPRPDGRALVAAATPLAEDAARAPASMRSEEIQREISELEKELEVEQAIERLNAEDVPEDERAELGETLQRVTILRATLAERDAELLTGEVDAYARMHAQRVAEIMAQAEQEQ